MAERPTTWDDLLRVWNLDPAEVEVVEPVQYRAWDALTNVKGPHGGEVVRLFYYRATVRKRRSGLNVDELVAAIGKRRPKPVDVTDVSGAYVIAVGDLQLGKVDGDGTEGTVRRFLAGLDASIARFRLLRKTQVLDEVHLAWLGDCIEGVTSQGGALIGRQDLTPTEQVRVLRRLMLEQVKAFSGFGVPVTLCVVPGNHDQVHRIGKTMATRYDDSWDVEAAHGVADALRLAQGFDHVAVVTPARDELTVTLNVAGTVIGHAHGHQMRGGTVKWWANQAHGRSRIGDADLLLRGHEHHLSVLATGGRRHAIQVPAMDGGSTWWRHETGDDSAPGIVTLTVAGGGWRDLQVLP